jgi:hypothetical protein
VLFFLTVCIPQQLSTCNLQPTAPNPLITIDKYNLKDIQLNFGMFQPPHHAQQVNTLFDSRYGSSQNSHCSGQVPQPQQMHRAPMPPSRKRENAKKDRTCVNAFKTLFKPTEQPVHQKPLPRVPMHEISALFAPQSAHEPFPGSLNPQAIPFKSLHDISPLFPRRIDHVANPTSRSQGEYLSPLNSNKLLMPQYPSPAKLCPSRRPVANTHDSLFIRAKYANLELVSGGEAEEYHRSFRPEAINHHGVVQDIPFVEDRQQRPYCCDLSFPEIEVTDESGRQDDVVVMRSRPQRHAVHVQATTRKPMAAQLRQAPAGKTQVDTDWRAHVAPLIRRGLVYPAVLDEAPTRQSMIAELCYASDSENDGDDEDSLCEPPRRDSFSVYETSSSAQSEQVAQEPAYDDEVQAEWSAIMMSGKDQACLTRFVHHWENPCAQPVDQSLFAEFDGDFTEGVEQQSLSELGSDCEMPRPASDQWGPILRPISDHWIPRPDITRFDSLPTVDRLCDAFLERNANHPDKEARRDMQPGVIFRDFYKFRTGKSF